MSDDVSMKALSGDFGEKTRAILAAGCDVVLHCNGDMDEMGAVAASARALSGRSLERARAVLARRAGDHGADEAALRDEFSRLTQAVA